MNYTDEGGKLISESKIKEKKNEILEERKILKEEGCKIYSYTPKINKM